MANDDDVRGVLLAVAMSSAVLLSSGCSMPDAPVSAEPRTQRNEDVLAVVAGVEVTRQEVAESAASQLTRLERERQEILEQGLQRLVADRLLAVEAAQRGSTVEEFLSAEIEDKLEPPTGEEIDAFYEQNKERIGQPQEQVVGQISEFLLQQRRSQARQQLIAALEERHGVQTFLEPYRVEVEADGYPAKGPSDAPVTIVEFSDFECPYCARVVPTLDRIVESYGDRVRLVFRQFPLTGIHPNAQKAAEAALCARDQEKFWLMHDAMFKEQRSLGVEQLKEKAARLGLETEAFNECLDSSRYSDAVAADLDAGNRLGVTGTPALFINGRFLSGAQPYETIASIVDAELEADKSGS